MQKKTLKFTSQSENIFEDSASVICFPDCSVGEFSFSFCFNGLLQTWVNPHFKNKWGLQKLAPYTHTHTLTIYCSDRLSNVEFFFFFFEWETFSKKRVIYKAEQNFVLDIDQEVSPQKKHHRESFASFFFMPKNQISIRCKHVFLF